MPTGSALSPLAGVGRRGLVGRPPFADGGMARSAQIAVEDSVARAAGEVGELFAAEPDADLEAVVAGHESGADGRFELDARRRYFPNAFEQGRAGIDGIVAVTDTDTELPPMSTGAASVNNDGRARERFAVHRGGRADAERMSHWSRVEHPVGPVRYRQRFSRRPNGWVGVFGAGLLLAAAPPALPFQADGAQTGAQPEAIEEVVVVGTRRPGQAAIESMSPVTVVLGERLREWGGVDMLDLLRDAVPSFNVNMQPIADGATVVRPPNIRNLAADHILVMVNGKRRHRGAVIAWLVPKASEGAQGPDLSVIPAIAVERVEVLTDGASAQYGSDAVAGVMNFVLKDANEGTSLEARYGRTGQDDGENVTLAVNRGFALGPAGFLNASLEYGASGDTVRSVQRADAESLANAGNPWIPNPAQIWGSPKVKDNFKTFVNLAFSPADRFELYGFGNYASKTTDGGFYYRNPNDREGVYTRGGYRLVGDLTGDDSGDCPRDLSPEGPFYAAGTFRTEAFNQAHPDCFVMNALFPGGFTPRFGGDTLDYSLFAGARGETQGGLSWDLTVGSGASEVDFFIANTVNAALGPANPADFRFDPGDYAQKESGVNLDMAYLVDIPGFASVTHLAFGAEWREEAFRIRGGEPASWERSFTWNGVAVDLQSQGFTAATNGFPGFSPDTAGNWSRSNAAIYVDLEADIRDNWAVGLALRAEDHEHFGATTNGKLSSRLELAGGLALRGTVSTGFRVPTSGQSNAINATSKQGGEGVERLLSIVSTVAPTSAVGLALGGAALEPEKSFNTSVGLVYTSERATATLDCFRIRVRDRLALSKDIELNRPDLGADRVREDLIGQLESEGLASARSWNYINYFTNDFTTVTSGCEAAGRYRIEAGAGVTTFSGVLNVTRTRVDRYTPGGPLDNAREIRDYEAGLPKTRYLFSVTHLRGPFRLSARYGYHGDWYDSEENLDFDGYGAFDAAMSYRMSDSLTLTLAAENLFDSTPGRNPNARSGLGNLYSQYAPGGFNGRFVFLKLALEY